MDFPPEKAPFYHRLSLHNLMAGGLLRFFPVIGLLVFFALAVGTAVVTAPTVDESVHVFRGQALWQTGEMRFQIKHTPLSHWLNGSLLFSEPTLPDVTSLPSWQENDRPTLAREFLWTYQPQPNIDRIFFLARIPIIWLGLLLGAVLMRWGRNLAGQIGQVLVSLLFAFSPNLLANFSLATTDGPLTAMYMIAVFSWYCYRQRPSWGRWLLASVTLGLGLGSKLTAVLLLPVLLVLSYIPWPRGRQRWWQPGLIWLSVLPVAGIVFWALYGFELRPLPGMPFPVPAATYVNDLLQFQDDPGGNYLAYLFGEVSTEGWWYYFIVAFLIKTPLPTLLLATTAVILIIRQKQWQATAYLWFPGAILFAFASYSRLNIGYRHILPILPFLFLLASTVFRNMLPSEIGKPQKVFRKTNSDFSAVSSRKRRRTKPHFVKRFSVVYLSHARSVKTTLILILSAWYIFGGLRQHPHHLAYFNEIVGGPDQGYHYLGDSNIDWGQSLKFLADYFVDTENDKPVYISYFGASDPAYYGLKTPPLFDNETSESLALTRANPAPGLYAISVNHWLGKVPDHDLFNWFRRREPIDNVGYSILVFDVSQQAPGSWVAYCNDPGPLLDETVVTQLVGHSDLRQVYFDCRSSWVFPDDGRPGWYILPQGETWPIIEQFPEHLQLVYVHGASLLEPSYAVWYWDGLADLSSWTVVTNHQVELPVRFGETADLTGYRVTPTAWWTIWQAQSVVTEPLTIAAHLYGDASTPTIADGLGFTSEQWQPGDWFVQLHQFEGVGNGRYLETGLYNYLTGERLANFVQLKP